MKKMQRLINLMLCATLALSFSNCGPLSPTPGVTNTCDILIFDNNARFQQVYMDLETEVDNLYESNVAEDAELLPLIKFELNNRFNSYRKFVFDHDQTINNDPDMDDYDNEADTIFEDDEIIKTLLSKDRLIIIGDSMKLYYDECLIFSVKVGKEKCDPAKIQQLLAIKSAIESKDYVFLSEPKTFDGVSIANNCGSTKSACGIQANLRISEINCDKPGGTAFVRIQADEIITNFFNGSCIIRKWKINGQPPFPNPPPDDKQVVISFDPTVTYQVFEVELKYTVIPTFCTETVTKKVYVSCGECHPCNLSWESINGNPFHILFTFENCPTIINNQPVSYEIGIQYGDGTQEIIKNSCTVKHLYPNCVKDYKVYYSFKAYDVNGQLVCDIPISDLIFQVIRPKMCCPDKQKLKSSTTYDNDTKRMAYKLKHKPEKIVVVAKYYQKNSHDKFKKRRADWVVNIAGPLTVNSTADCICNKMIPWNYSLIRSDRKRVKLKKDVGQTHYLQQGNEWKAGITVNGTLFTAWMDAACN